jgi:hypothetical protein
VDDRIVEVEETLRLTSRQLRKRELDAGYMAVRAEDDDNEPLTGLPADADVVILTMPIGGRLGVA